MNNYLSSIIAGLIMFLVFLLFKIEVSYLLCLIGLILMVNGIQKYYDYKSKISILLSAIISLVGLSLIHMQYKLNYFVIGLFLLILVVLLILDFKYQKRIKKVRLKTNPLLLFSFFSI